PATHVYLQQGPHKLMLEIETFYAIVVQTNAEANQMANDLLERLRRDADHFTASERVIASFVLDNAQTVQFESASSLASKLQISAMTISRFARRMGFRHFTEMRDSLRATPAEMPWLSGSSLADF